MLFNTKSGGSNMHADSRPAMAINAPPSILSEDILLTGDITSEGEVQIDGKIEGDIRCRSLVIGKTGMAVGIINADEVKVYGAITGQIFAKSVFLAKTARLIGDVTHESIAIEPGAYMEGHCRRVNDPIHAEANKNPDLMLTDERKDKSKDNKAEAKKEEAKA